MSSIEKEVKEVEPVYFTNFIKLFEGKKRVAIFTHADPDPDAIGSIMGLEFLIRKKFNIEAIGFYTGEVSHPQNSSIVNLLEPTWLPSTEYSADKFDLNVVVDATPSNAGIKKDVKFNLIIDHHPYKEQNGGFDGLYIHLKAGSCCAMIYHLMKLCDIQFENNEQDSKIATALMVGISTDTENMISDDTSPYEFDAWQNLFPYRNTINLKKIIKYERPMFWVESMANAAKSVQIEEGLGIVGIGNIPAIHRSVLAEIADYMVTWEEVNTAVVFAIIDGKRIEGSVRSRMPSFSVPKTCAELAHVCDASKESGGGKLGKGAYKYDLGGGGVLMFASDEDDNDAILKMVVNKEVKRIQKTIKKSI